VSVNVKDDDDDDNLWVNLGFKLDPRRLRLLAESEADG